MTIFKENPFRPAPDGPLYQQIYAHLQAAIRAGRLPGGTKLPSTRALVDELRVSRNTVLTAYEQLIAEGYIEGVKGSGTYVARVLPDFLLTSSTHRVPKASQLPSIASPAAEPYQPGLSQGARAQLTSSQISSRVPPSSSGRPRPFRLGWKKCRKGFVVWG